MSRKKHPKSQWLRGNEHIKLGKKIEDSRWERTKRGWKYKTDQVGVDTWLARRREDIGWFHGAKITPAQRSVAP